MLVTGSLGAVTRTVLETIRTAMVWVLNLLLYYAGRQAAAAQQEGRTPGNCCSRFRGFRV